MQLFQATHMLDAENHQEVPASQIHVVRVFSQEITSKVLS